MAGTYKCPKCESQTTVDEGDAPLCVPCMTTMVLIGAQLDGDPNPGEPEIDRPVAPANVEAYQKGLVEIEDAKRNADQQEREYLRAKEYASKAKKRLESAESFLREIVQRVADRLRPRPLFEAADHHTDQELIALLAAEHVEVTADQVTAWTDAERADARAWALAAHSEQPRLMPPFLFMPKDDPDEPESAARVCEHGVATDADCAQCQAKWEAEDVVETDPEEPPQNASEPASEAAPPEPEHHYPGTL